MAKVQKSQDQQDKRSTIGEMAVKAVVAYRRFVNNLHTSGEAAPVTEASRVELATLIDGIIERLMEEAREKIGRPWN